MKFVDNTDITEIHYEGELIYRKQSKFQLIEIFDTVDFGRVLMLDNEVQLTTSDEKIYHTALTKELLNKEIHSLLIIGGGDGGALREACAILNKDVTIDLVELDPDVISACREHLPTLSNGAFDDPRVTIYNEDGFKFIENTHNRYDAIIIDLNDRVELFYDKTLSEIVVALKDDGMLICYLGIGNKMTGNVLFKSTEFYRIVVPSFVFGYTWFSINRL